MIWDLQKASVLKRASAFLLDFILLSILAVGFAALVSAITQYDTYVQTDTEITNVYAEQYFGMKWDDFKSLNDEERKAYQDVYEEFDKALYADEEYTRNFSMIMSLTLLMISLGLFFAILVLEFIMPLILKNGQTVGKKIFGIAVIRPSGVKASTFALFIRAMIGKYTIETMFPIMIFMMMFTVTGFGLVALVVLIGLAALQIAVYVVSKTNSLIHDMISDTVSVDLASQLIFDDDAALAAYKARVAAERAERSPY